MSAPLHVHRARIAEAWRHGTDAEPARMDPGVARLGRFTLRPDQLAAIGRIRAAFAEFGGALLADPPGAGKTIVALAVAHAAPDALIVVPAALRAQWARAASESGVTVRIVSFESLSRSAQPTVARGGVVVVDEAHHARTPGTRRYARLAECCLGARVLLLSATPVVNRTADRQALLALFLGARRPGDDAALARCVIRRASGGKPAGTPAIVRLAPLALPHAAPGRRIAELIRGLPPPFPASDGAAALALIRVTLAMAWSSSLAALDSALRRRIQRGQALADSLAEGAWPTRAALRQWVVGDDATQLALPGLDPHAAPPPEDAARLLGLHLDATRALRAIVAREVADDTRSRANALRALLAREPQRRVVTFARHASTVRALWSALRTTPGAIAITGARVQAVAGRWRREEVLAALGPLARPLRPGDRRMIRLLLTTDLLAEGVELQGMGVVVHADGAWTPATMEQREGRVARPSVGARTIERREVLVTGFTSPPDAVPLLRLGARLARKERLRQQAVQSAECRAAVDALFARWTSERRPGAGRPAATGPEPHCDGFLAALRLTDDTEIVVAGRRTVGSRWRITDSPCAIARIAANVTTAPTHCGEALMKDIRRALARWVARTAACSMLGASAAPPRASAARWRALRARVDRMLQDTSIAGRSERAAALERSLRILASVGGAGAEHQLAALLRGVRAASLGAREFEDALHALANRNRQASGGEPPTPSSPRQHARPVLLAVVLAAQP